MRKLRMAVALPLVFIAISIAIFGWHLAPPGGFDGNVRWWFALNAPVLLVIDLTKRIVAMAHMSPEMIWGGGGERSLYLIGFICGFGLWIIVGRALDNRLEHEAVGQPTP